LREICGDFGEVWEGILGEEVRDKKEETGRRRRSFQSLNSKQA
jgi:hypothetical protein